MSNVRLSYTFLQPLEAGFSNARVSVIFASPLTGGYPETRVPLISADPLTGGYPNVRVPIFFLEVLQPIEPEPHMSTNPFPGFGNSASNPALPAAKDPFNTPLPGLSFSVHKKPRFSTRISESASGHEVRSALMQYPRWEFELSYEYLEDSANAESSLKTIMGFFLARQGSYDSWLFKDPDDYQVTNGFLGESDGLTPQYAFARSMGEFLEVVGQVDTANSINLYLSVEEAASVPGSDPRTVTVANAASFEEDLGVVRNGSEQMTRVTSSPTSGQYSVDEETGVYTFSSANSGSSLAISYRYLVDPSDYTITMPNLVTFSAAPPAGTLTADFQYFFVCRFIEDEMDFEKFADKLWNLQSCEFRSVLQ
jgi:hypothetical protein